MSGNPYLSNEYVVCPNCGGPTLRTIDGICYRCEYEEFEVRDDYQDFIAREVDELREENICSL